MKKPVKFLTIYIIIINYFFFLNWASVQCCDVFADVNAIYFTSFRWIMNVGISFELQKVNFWENAF